MLMLAKKFKKQVLADTNACQKAQKFQKVRKRMLADANASQ